MENFISPGMLWFALAGAVPIIIHLWNRQKYRRVRWAAMEFLLRALQKTRRRLLLEDLILLALRVALLVLLAAALAQPLLRHLPLAALASSDTHFVIVLDNSYSMAYQKPGVRTPFDRAKAAATTLLNQVNLAQGDKVSLLLLSDAPTALMADPSIQIDLAKRRLAELSLSDRGTSMARTLPLVADVVARSTLTKKKVVILTDFQKSAWNVEDKEKAALHEAVAKISAAPGATVHLVDVGADERRNLGIERLETKGKLIRTEASVRFEAEVKNFGDEPATANVTFFVDNARQQTVAVPGEVVPPHRSGAAVFDCTFHEPGPHVVTAELDPDPILADNKRSLAIDAHTTLQVLLVDGEPSADMSQDETAFLRLALNPTTDELERVSIFAIDTVTPISFPETPLRKYELVVLANLDMVYEEKMTELENYVKAGGGLLIFLGDKVSKSGYNELFWKHGDGLLPAQLKDIAGDKTHQHFVKFEKPDLNHDALSFFAAQPTLFTHLPVYEYYQAEPDVSRPEVRILAWYNDNAQSPALIERRFGRGKVILFTTTADYEWTDMIKEQGYLIVMDQLAQYLASQPQTFKNVQVGTSLEYFLRLDEYAKLFNLITPRQGVTALAPAKVGEQGFYLTYKNTEDAGVYALERPGEEGNGKTELVSYFTVNVDPTEGNLDRITDDEIRQRFPEFKFTVQRDSGQHGETLDVKPPPSKIWKYLAFTVLAIAVAEMLLAMQFGRRK